MKYDKNVIDILKMYGESKSLIVEVEDERRTTFSGEKVNTVLNFRDKRYILVQKVLLTWPEDMDAVGVIKGVMNSIDNALIKHETKDLDIASLYPKTMLKTALNSVYGARGGYTHMDDVTLDDYLHFDVKMTNLMNKRLNSPKPLPSIKNVIFNDPATIVFWSDNTKTIVKAQDGDTFDAEKGLAMAICKKAYGNKGNYCEKLKKWLEAYDGQQKIINKIRVNIDIGKLKASRFMLCDAMKTSLTKAEMRERINEVIHELGDICKEATNNG